MEVKDKVRDAYQVITFPGVEWKVEYIPGTFLFTLDFNIVSPQSSTFKVIQLFRKETPVERGEIFKSSFVLGVF